MKLTTDRYILAVFFVLLFLFFVYQDMRTAPNHNTEIKTGIHNALTDLAEKTYFLGQRDAIQGDVRIKYDEEHSCWSWTKSPWYPVDKAPIYDNCKESHETTSK